MLRVLAATGLVVLAFGLQGCGATAQAPPSGTTTAASPTQVVTRKRGFSGFLEGSLSQGGFTCEDAAALGLEDSWHYTWMTVPSQRNKCAGRSVSSEFVPMINGVKAAQNAVKMDFRKQWASANVHFLLGYNEPDYGNGHNHPHMATPASAAANWPLLQKIAAQFDPPLTLVAPGISSGAESGGSDAWDADGRSTWLDDFLGNCTHVVKECDPSLIKYIAMHDYQGDVAKLKRRISGMAKLYNRKVWVTEIAITKWGSPPNREKQNAFMKEVLPYLDSSDDIFRYVWFTARNSPNQQNGGSNLLELDGSVKLTSTGQIYKNQKSKAVEVVV